MLLLPLHQLCLLCFHHLSLLLHLWYICTWGSSRVTRFLDFAAYTYTSSAHSQYLKATLILIAANAGTSMPCSDLAIYTFPPYNKCFLIQPSITNFPEVPVLYWLIVEQHFLLYLSNTFSKLVVDTCMKSSNRKW